MTERCIFSCFVDPETVDNVLDCLLVQTFVTGFSMQKIEGYSKDHASYSVSEQVAGYRAICRIDIQLAQADIEALSAALKALALQHPIRYWVTPVLESGVI